MKQYEIKECFDKVKVKGTRTMKSTDRKRLIIHHDDLDGYVGGCICRANNENAEVLCLNYDNKEKLPNTSFFLPYKQIFIVDYSFSPQTMLWLQENKDVRWIDHHVTAIKNSKDHGYNNMSGLRDTDYCGAELAWKYYYGEKTPIPEFIKMVGEFDTFRSHKDKRFFNDSVMPFFYGCQSFIENLNPLNYGDENFSGTIGVFENDKNVSKMIKVGKPIFEYLRQTWRENASTNAFVRKIWGYNVLCLNSAENGSMQLDESFDASKHDIMLKFHFNGKNWCYGVYTDTNAKPNINVGEIASKYGGGGHKGAGGFTAANFLPELK